jgi:citronellol/citronellal dehydrogenase
VALGLASEGAHVTIAAKSEAADPKLPGTIHSVAAEVAALGVEALAVRVDVRDDAQVDAMVAKTVERFGRVDILINNAGALWWQPVLETPMKRYDLINDVNSRGAFTCTRAALPHMLAGGFGQIVNYSPPIMLDALPGKVAYCISKFGMTMLAHGLAEEVRGRGVAINALWPVTAIESLATINFQLGGPAMWRKPDILVDATLEVVTTAPDALSGEALLDEDFLRTRGWTDFTKYRCDPEHEPPRVMPSDLPSRGLVPGKA